MDPYQTIKQVAKLAQPFSPSTFAQLVSTDENAARDHLGQLMGMGWVTSEYDNATGDMAYLLTDSGRQQAAST